MNTTFQKRVMPQTKTQIFLFTDGSVDPQSGVGFGAYLLLNEIELFSAELEKKIKLKKFEKSSSTQLELETLLWALDDFNLKNFKVVIYTDCQNIITLKSRREKLQKRNYMNSRGKEIKNHALYKDFFARLESLECEFIKLKGHKRASVKNEIDEIFTLVDKATRRALRKDIS